MDDEGELQSTVMTVVEGASIILGPLLPLLSLVCASYSAAEVVFFLLWPIVYVSYYMWRNKASQPSVPEVGDVQATAPPVRNDGSGFVQSARCVNVFVVCLATGFAVPRVVSGRALPDSKLSE